MTLVERKRKLLEVTTALETIARELMAEGTSDASPSGYELWDMVYHAYQFANEAACVIERIERETK
jgi:hypothetical protein